MDTALTRKNNINIHSQLQNNNKNNPIYLAPIAVRVRGAYCTTTSKRKQYELGIVFNKLL